jgi:hypothetical protein
MKTTFALIVSLLLSSVIAFAVARRPVVIPKSKHTIAEALKLAEAQWQDAEIQKKQLIAVAWCRSDHFRGPEWFFGGTWPAGDAEWAWFVTYATRSKKTGAYEDVFHLRVRENGEVNLHHPPRI